MTTMRARLLAVLVGIAALAIPAAPASAAGFSAQLKAPNHSPKGGAKSWRITVSARTRSGQPLRATAVYKFLYNGQVVSTQNPWPGHSKGGPRPWSFRGSYRDTILWPARAAGYPITFRVVVSSPGRGSVNLDWKVRVRR
ncbi:hypothetical protein [Capillimicrobium parvum]|nr:hypothetical protein [Capillimicrobium parvum]